MLHILHIDLNSCFATALQQAFYHMRGKPVVAVAYETPNGCVLSPSIEAKEYGIKTGMRLKDAQVLCPQVIYKMPDTGMVRDIHLKFKKICDDYSPDMTPKSIDELVIDFTPMNIASTDQIVQIGYEIKKRIRSEVGDWMRCNVGISMTRFLAKVASNLHKPDGLDVISKKDIPAIYKRLSLTDLPGINVRYQARLNQSGIFTVVDFYNASALHLKKQVFGGIVGYYWYERLRGVEVDGVDWKRKTYGQDYALRKKTNNPREISRILMKLCEKMGRRLRRAGYSARGIHVGCSYDDNTYWHKGRKVNHPMYTTHELFKEARYTLDKQPEKKVVSKLTVRSYDLTPHIFSQPTLFDTDDKRHKSSEALDKINDTYGEFTITSALMMDMDDMVLDRIAFGSIKELKEVNQARGW